MADVIAQVARLADLRPHPRNYNRHPARQVERIAASLRTFGQVRSIVVWRGTILAGHGVVEAARGLGWESLRADVLPDEYPEHLALAYVAADNELGRLADPDMEQLAAILDESRQADAALLEAIGYDEQEFQALLAEVGQATAEPGRDTEPQVDRAEELRQKWGVEPGQLWALGDHRMICGDCTDPAVVARVMGGEKAEFCFTDPPYNVGLKYANDESDSLSRDDYSAWCVSWLKHCPRPLLLTPGVKHMLWWDAIIGVPQWTLAWIKRNGQSQTGFLGTNKWDPILAYDCKPDHGIDIVDVNNDYSGKVSRELGHHGAKPAELWQAIIQRFCPRTALIYEPFSGSGTTLIACENLGRRCRAVEIAPGYVAVALERWATHTGKTPERIDG